MWPVSKAEAQSPATSKTPDLWSAHSLNWVSICFSEQYSSVWFRSGKVSNTDRSTGMFSGMISLAGSVQGSDGLLPPSEFQMPAFSSIQSK